ncbi:MAG: hypothetical protein GTN38_00830 [Candidatus Aenigmarchaeota archaeon]|nr:hypothetical protein [Candidatus Aenigmarchaeota archaeon]NIP40131.1 hypothetical protein [Candidatus Aenigmarchaeota archaeon]NIQ18208.1 hypothetical protein [Candidatus Aenigmarchaeota archaeon]NIS72965.1 hypothetical protein [Candidatus Aenigmarchaeota archaeon]
MFTFLFGWNRKIRKLRKRWDRLREKALKKKQPMKGDILTKMDVIEQNLRVLEERRVSRVERSRLAKEIEIDLEGIKAMIKMKEDEYAQQKSAPMPSQQKYQTRPG